MYDTMFFNDHHLDLTPSVQPFKQESKLYVYMDQLMIHVTTIMFYLHNSWNIYHSKIRFVIHINSKLVFIHVDVDTKHTIRLEDSKLCVIKCRNEADSMNNC